MLTWPSRSSSLKQGGVRSRRRSRQDEAVLEVGVLGCREGLLTPQRELGAVAWVREREGPWGEEKGLSGRIALCAEGRSEVCWRPPTGDISCPDFCGFPSNN